MDEIPALTANARVERPDRDPSRQHDPRGRRRHQPPKPPSAQPAPATAPEPPTDAVVGTRLNVRG